MNDWESRLNEGLTREKEREEENLRKKKRHGRKGKIDRETVIQSERERYRGS